MSEATKKKADLLIKRKEALEEIRRPWVDLWQQSVEHILPYRTFMPDTLAIMRGQKVGQKIYSSAPVDALQTYSDGMAGSIFAPKSDWFRLRFAQKLVNQLPDAPEWLDEVEEILYDIFADSSFYMAAHQLFKDGGGFGTADMYIEEDIDNDAILFSTRHMAELFLAEDRHQKVDTVVREFDIEAREAIKQFGEETFKTIGNTQLVTDAKDNPYKRYPFLHAIYPREDRLPGVQLGSNKKYASEYVDMTVQDMVRESGYDAFPHAAWRVDKNSFETYGRGPATDSLADILGVNAMSRDLLTAVQKSVNPALLADAGLKPRLKLKPGAVTFARRAHETVRAINESINVPVGEEYLSRLEQAIYRRFRVDFFLILANSDKPMTATEVGQLQEEKAVMLGPMIGRLESDVLDSIIERVYSIAEEAGKLPPAPPSLQRYGGSQIKIEYLGILAQAQERAATLHGPRRALEMLAMLSQFDERQMDWADLDEITPELLESAGFPAKAIRNKRQVQRVRAALIEQMMAEQQHQAMLEAADAYPKISKSPEQGSPAALQLPAPTEAAS